MAIVFSCTCGKSIEVSQEYAGKQVRCPFCGAIVVAPEQSPFSAPAAESAPHRFISPPGTVRKHPPMRDRKRTSPRRGSYSARRRPARYRERDYDDREESRYGSPPRRTGRSPVVPVIIAVCAVVLVGAVLYILGGGAGTKYARPDAAIDQFLSAISEGRTADAGACLDPATSDQSAQSAINFLSTKLGISTDGRGLDYTLIEPDVDREQGRATADVRISGPMLDRRVVNTTFYAVRTRGYWYVLPK